MGGKRKDKQRIFADYLQLAAINKGEELSMSVKAFQTMQYNLEMLDSGQTTVVFATSFPQIQKLVI